MKRSFLQAYLEAFNTIEGWFSYDAALLFMAYNEIIARHGVAGDVLEIGVHHGLSAIAIAALRGPGKRFYAVDLFEKMQDRNVSHSGRGNRRIFERNIKTFHCDTSFMQVIAGPSSALSGKAPQGAFSFCHIDGGHSRAETYHDLKLCHSLLMPGGLAAVDDYFNPLFPGVSEGCVQFALEAPGAFRPLAIAYNKIVFQKLPARADSNSELLAKFPGLQHMIVPLWDAPAVLVGSPLRSLLDLHASTPAKLVLLGSVPRVRIEPAEVRIDSAAGRKITLPVGLRNVYDEPLPSGQGICGLSYHLLSATGEMLRHDNDRSWLATPVEPGETRTVLLQIEAPPEPGDYRLEVDLVWEQVMWFKDVGNPTALVDLSVR